MSEQTAPCPLIVVQAAECFNFAAWQNAVPLLSTLGIDNSSGGARSSLRLQLTAAPAFLREKHWTLERIAAGEVFAVRDLDLEVDPAFLDNLDEAERGVLEFQLSENGQQIASARKAVRVLARDEWGGMGTMGELLAAYVTPNDPALAPVLKSAAEVLAKHGHSPALDGYQSKDPNRAYLLAASLWSAIAGKSLTYANPPSSFEQVGQKTRRVSAVLSEGLATCLDSTLLFASALEAVGLNSIVVMTSGHCFVGVWLVEKTLKRLVEFDGSEVRKAIAGRELITFETTLITQRPPARFPDAVSAAAAMKERDFVAAVDITRARMSQIRPLASHQARKGDEQASAGPLPLPAAPSFSSTPIDEAEERPSTPSGRLDRWKRKLLDLSLRNRLLNFKPNQQTIPVLCPDVSRLEDLLADGGRLRLISLPEQNPLGARDAMLHQKRTNKDLDLEFAGQALDRYELACPLPRNDLDGRLTTLFRKVRSDLAEGGSNTLYLAVGFLKWKQTPTDEKSYRAPLLLVPVTLSRRSVSAPFYLAHHEDDVRFNFTLLQLLKKDFDCTISGFDAGLPTDDRGVDVPRVLERMRREVRDIPGLEVVDETAISTFSFAKYLMWKDLADREAQLQQNRVVRHLIQEPEKPFRSDGVGTMPKPDQLDTRYSPREIVHLLPADSSQLSAVMTASAGHDFVLVGPPGTGKSQTIANLIAQCLSVGKTVLFVAEKTAALDVVYRRLRAHGLGDCCVELHSNKAERRRFLDQLQASWQNNVRRDAGDWVTVSERLKLRRDELNTYVAAIHTEHANGWTAYRAMGVCVKGQSLAPPAPQWSATVRHDRVAYDQIARTVDELALTFGAIRPEAALSRIRATQWSAAWEARLLKSAERMKSAAEGLRSALERFSAAIGLPAAGDCSIEHLGRLNQFAQTLAKCASQDVSTLFHKRFGQFPAALTQLKEQVVRHDQAIAKASARYAPDQLDAIPIDDLDRQWREAGATFWPLSWLGKRKVARLLQSYAAEGIANPALDLAAIRELRNVRSSLAANPLTSLPSHWRGLETDTESLHSHLRLADEVRSAILAIGQPLKATSAISRAVLPALRDTSAAHPIIRAAKEQLRRAAEFTSDWRGYTQEAGASPASKNSGAIVRDSIQLADRVLASRAQLKQWTAWCAVKARATGCGLASFVAALEAGKLEPAELRNLFELAYARWWLPIVIDSSETLRNFQRSRHEHAIEDFRRLDDLARKAAPSQVLRAVFQGLPASEQVPRKSELGLLRHQMGLKRPSKSIRELIAGMPETFGKLAPCLMVSPLSIAQYLPPGQAMFDVVVFDEASQIATWDAVGAIARGKQTIIVGDPKQLPPTNFFGRADDDEDNEELDDHEKDLESILDEAVASGLPELQLNWHYRSRHESLIAFSNYYYYGNRLITFPAADSTNQGVSLRRVEGVYDRGKSRTNRGEAEAIVAEAVSRMKCWLAKPEAERLTLGVVTFNLPQQKLIEDLFDEALKTNPELEWFFSADRIEPTIVKNLENVQGDERDVMFFSITFGFDAAGMFPVSFGAINSEGGERRLNVAVTRARQELVVFSSFLPEQLRAERSQAKGVRDLKAFLEYAEKGPLALAARNDGSVGELESPFEEAVAEALQARGWQVEPQIGVSKFRVDLGIVHPDKPGAYLAGIECDGATYHRSASARDRDKTRQQVLENLGWNILRIWSPDWWYDPQSALEQTHKSLEELLQRDRDAMAAKASATTQASPVVQTPSQADELPEPADRIEAAPDDCLADQEATWGEELHRAPAPRLVARQVQPQGKVYYVRAELPDVSANQERFFDEAYSDTLRQLAQDVLDTEAPIRDDVLARQVARAHGFLRTGQRIRQRILDLLPDATASEEPAGKFLWSTAAPLSLIPFRYATAGGERRSLDEISRAELAGLVQARPDLANDEDPALALAREIGLARLAQAARERLEAMIETARAELGGE